MHIESFSELSIAQFKNYIQPFIGGGGGGVETLYAAFYEIFHIVWEQFYSPPIDWNEFFLSVMSGYKT